MSASLVHKSLQVLKGENNLSKGKYYPYCYFYVYMYSAMYTHFDFFRTKIEKY